MQKKGGTKALFGRPNRSNRPFAFFVRIDKDFLSFALLFSLFFVHCRFCAFLLCFYSAVFLSSRQKALPFLLPAGFFAVLPLLFCCFTPVFLLHCRCFSPSDPIFPAGQTSSTSCVAPLLLPHRSGCPLFSFIAFSVFFTDAKIPAKNKNGADLKQVQIRSVF